MDYLIQNDALPWIILPMAFLAALIIFGAVAALIQLYAKRRDARIEREIYRMPEDWSERWVGTDRRVDGIRKSGF